MPARNLSPGTRHTVIDSIAAVNPEYCVPQSDAAQFMLNIEGLSAPLKKRLPAIYSRSGIDQRYTCLADYTKTPDRFEFLPRNWSLAPAVSTGARNRVYQTTAIDLAERAARSAMVNAGIACSATITHVITVSCTGFFAPGLDIHLVKRLRLPLNTDRTMIGFMGCYAAFNGLKAAHAICQSVPGARVLLVCVELCSLHFQIDNTLESVVVNAIFSDGAAAALISSRKTSEAEGMLEYRAGCCQMHEDSMDAMTWDVGDTGYTMGLSSRVPDIIAGQLPGYIDSLLSGTGESRATVDFWAIHPGGRQIIDRSASVLDLTADDLHDSYETLRLHGNMSSPTILFVLKRILDRHTAQRRQGSAGYRSGVALAFGPGLTIEGCLFGRVGAEGPAA